VFRAGFWYERANTDRFQTPVDPRAWIDLLTPSFHEKFITRSARPFAQYEWHATKRLVVTGGFKMTNYNVHLLQYSDNGKTIGCVGGAVVAVICKGGLDFLTHTANYRAWQPTADARYRLKDNWSVYGQYATGNVIPPSNVFDVKNAAVAVTPKPTQTKTFQFGTVYKTNRFTIHADACFIHADNQLRVASSPHDTETLGLTYLKSNWDIGFFNKRIGQLYNDNCGNHQAIAIDPLNITNLFINYTIKQASYLRGTKFRVGINNLFDRHNIVGVAAASPNSNLPAPGDFLTLMAGRSVSLAVTFGYAPRR
jgi:iron complex outermembrane receptor protein